MIPLDFLVWFCVFSCLLMFVAGICLGMAFGRDLEQGERVNRDLADADKMRAAIREYDDRVAKFAPSAVRHAQSLAQHERLPGTLTTALASPAPSAPRRICPRGPEACLCDDCLSRGIPPSP